MTRKWTTAELPSLAGKTAIVTGANSGLGLETTAGLAAAGATVIMACRNPARAEPALAALRVRVPGAKLAAMALDLADLASVRRFAAEFAAQQGPLHLLINNAGVMALPWQQTADGFEMQMGTNHLGHFALTGLLLERLAASPGARVITVASVAHRGTKKLPVDDLNWQREPYRKNEAYARSKLANLLFSHELARRLAAAGVPVLAAAAHPGYSATNIVASATAGSAIKQFLGRIGNALVAQPAHMGALPTLYAAAMPGVQAGDYYGPHGLMEFRGYPKKVGGSALAGDAKLAAGLWQRSQQLTGVTYL